METKKKSLKKPSKATEQPTAAAQPQQAQAGQQAPQPDPTALSIGDLKNLSVILDVASSRGAFKAAELSAVGTIFDKLSKFLTSLDEQMAAQKEAEASEEKK